MINDEKISIAGIRRMLSLIPCWKIKDCPDDVRANCSAFTQHDKPCWMVSDKTWEAKSEQCRECIVYTEHAGCQSLKETIAAFTIQEPSKQAAMAG